jgi:PhnB protein
MHACLQIGESQVLVADGYAKGQPQFEGVSLALTAADDAEARRLFAALAADGEVQVPLGPSFFASSFGMLTDRFGLAWMVIAGRTSGP